MKNLKIKFFLIFTLLYACFLLQSSTVYSQSKINTNFSVYIDARQLNDTTYNFLAANNISEVKRITTRVIKPDSIGKINKEEIEKEISRLYLHNSDTGICVIDWEGKEFNDLNTLDENDPRFKFLLEQFEEVIATIKSMRPNVAVGIYGLPVRFNNFNPARINTYNIKKLYPLLKNCDFINPSYYILYADEEIGRKKNINYLKENLRNALQAADDLDKPVIVYVASRYYNHSSKKYLQLIPQNEFKNYSNFLANYKDNNGKKISGLILWNGDDSEPTLAKKQMIGSKFLLPPTFINDHNSMLRNYLSIMLQSKK